jgi:hypothetical protein
MTSIYLDIVCATFPKVEASMAVGKSGKTWSESEEENHQPTKKIFASKSGDWTFIADGAITKLKKGGNQVGSLNDFNPDTAQVGDSGSGYSTEKDVDFQWTVIDREKSSKRIRSHKV